jgi:hypothetical protein
MSTDANRMWPLYSRYPRNQVIEEFGSSFGHYPLDLDGRASCDVRLAELNLPADYCLGTGSAESGSSA